MTKFFRMAVLAGAMSLIFFAGQVSAQVITTINFSQVGPNVIATFSGSFDQTGFYLDPEPDVSIGTGVQPERPGLWFGLAGNTIDIYRMSGFSGPADFGPGTSTFISFANSNTGDDFSFFKQGGGFTFYVPVGYSGGTLSGTGTWNNQTFTSLGMTPGTYTWYAGNNTIQLNIQAVPEPGSMILTRLALAGAGGGAFWRRRKGKVVESELAQV